jgi:16S rRNA (guanine527-N7)-methyltransferase
MLLDLLENGLEKIGLAKDSLKTQQWLAYIALLHKWNKAFNLTAVQHPSQMLYRHLFDSLSVASLIDSRNLLDVGAGAGLPSIPLAILWADRNIARIEDYQPAVLFDGVISRAYTALSDFVTSSSHATKQEGEFFAMKAHISMAEREALPKEYKIVKCQRLHVQGCEAERHLVIVERC